MPSPDSIIRVELGLGSSERTALASVTWTDVSSYVPHAMAGTAVNIRSGRTDEQTVAQAGTLDLALDNTDGRFTPGWTGGTYGDDIVPGIPIRVSAAWSDTTVTRLFTGYVDEWRALWAQSGHRLVSVSATDRLALLGGESATLRSVVENEILSDGPLAYYRLGEPAGSDAATSIATATQPDLVRDGDGKGAGASLEFGAAVGAAFDELDAPVWVPAVSGSTVTATAYLSTDLATGGTAAVWSQTQAVQLEAWIMLFDFVGTTVHNPIRFTDAAGTTYVEIGVAANTGQIYARSSVGGSINQSAGPTFPTNSTMHVVAQFGHGSPVRIWINGALYSGTTTLTAPASPATLRHLTVGQRWWGMVSHAAVYTSTNGAVLSQSRITDHYLSGKTAFADELTSDRVARLARWGGVPTAEQSLDTGSSYMGRQAYPGQSILSRMQEAERVERGVLFVDGAGLLQFRSRSSQYGLTATATFAAADDEVTDPLALTMNRQWLANDVAMTRTDGGSVRLFSSSSIAAYGRQVLAESLAFANDAEAAGAAAYWRDLYSIPSTRVTDLAIDLTSVSEARAKVILTAQPGTVVAVTGLTTGAPASVARLAVHGGSHSVVGGQWVRSISTAPAPLATQTPWLLGTVGRSELGTTTILGY